MVTLKTESFRKYSFLSSSAQKSSNFALYLDFRWKVGQFVTTSFVGTIPLAIDGDLTGINNCWVNVELFMSVCSLSDDILFDGQKFFTDKGEFHIPIQFTKNEVDYSELTIRAESTKISLPSEFTAHFIEASQFCGEEDFSGIVLSKELLTSSNRRYFYRSTLNLGLETPVILPSQILALLPRSGLVYEFVIQDKKLFISYEGGDAVVQVIKRITSEALLTLLSPELEGMLTHTQYISLRKEEILSILRFMVPFLSNTQGRLDILTLTVGEGEVFLEVKYGAFATRQIGLKEQSKDMVGRKILISASLFSKLISTIADEYIRIYLDSDKQLIKVVGDKNTSKVLASSKFREDQ